MSVKPETVICPVCTTMLQDRAEGNWCPVCDRVYANALLEDLWELHRLFKLCQKRMIQGSREYGLRGYMNRDNLADAQEEVADATLYQLFGLLKAKRAMRR